jgi:hypothetical protein
MTGQYIRHQRKPDAYVGITSKKPVLSDIIVPFEWTNVHESLNRRCPKLGKKLRQIAFNAADLLVEQGGRISIPAMAICGATAFILLLDRECLRIATIEDCWEEGLVQLSAAAHLLLNINMEQAGFLPHFKYVRCVKGLIPHSLRDPALLQDLNSDPARSGALAGRVRILAHPLPGDTPFSRGTTVLSFKSEDPVDSKGGNSALELILKVQHVPDCRYGREPRAYRALRESKIPEDIKDHLPECLGVLVFPDHPHQTPILPAHLVARHVQYLLARNPKPDLKRLTDMSSTNTPQNVVRVLQSLVLVVHSLHQHARILHRDISPGNVLHNNGHLVLVDFDCAIVQTNSPTTATTEPRTGTLVTMARDVIKRKTHTILHDFESIVHLLMHVVALRLEPSAEGEEQRCWRLWRFTSDLANDADDVLIARGYFWKHPAEVYKTLEDISPALAKLVYCLLSSDPTPTMTLEALLNKLPTPQLSASETAESIQRTVDLYLRALQDASSSLNEEERSGTSLLFRRW